MGPARPEIPPICHLNNQEGHANARVHTYQQENALLERFVAGDTIPRYSTLASSGASGVLTTLAQRGVTRLIFVGDSVMQNLFFSFLCDIVRSAPTKALAAAANPLHFRAKEGTQTAPCAGHDHDQDQNSEAIGQGRGQGKERDRGQRRSQREGWHARPCWIPLPMGSGGEVREANVQQAALPILVGTGSVMISVVMVSANKEPENLRAALKVHLTSPSQRPPVRR